MIIVAAFQHAWNIYFWDLLGYFLDTMTLIGWRSDCYILVGVSSIRPEIRCISSAADSCGRDPGSQVLPSKLPDTRGLANGALKGEYEIEHTHELIMHLWRINIILASESIVPIIKCDIIWLVFPRSLLILNDFEPWLIVSMSHIFKTLRYSLVWRSLCHIFVCRGLSADYSNFRVFAELCGALANLYGSWVDHFSVNIQVFQFFWLVSHTIQGRGLSRHQEKSPSICARSIVLISKRRGRVPMVGECGSGFWR